MNGKSADIELSQLKNALRFLADEFEHAANDRLQRGKQTRARSKAAYFAGESRAHYRAAGAVHLVVNMIATLEEGDEIESLSVVREIVKAISQ